ncbi:hypothetical protein BJX70DRAFT_410400 [Aspergillus crustosus]
MPLKNYGVWKAHPLSYEIERAGVETPHLTLRYNNNNSEVFNAAINIESADPDESQLVFWVNDDMASHPLVDELESLSYGYESLESDEPGPTDRRLGYIRRNLFDRQLGRVLPHDIPEENNDIIDVLKPIFQRATDGNEKATVYIFGERYGDKKGIHNVHMNQGNIARFARGNGVFQDGGLVFHFPAAPRNHWIGVFLAFASQTIHTSNRDGRAIGQTTWKDILPEDLVENSVAIRRAMVDPPVGGEQSVTLENLTHRRVSLSGWSIRNSSRDDQNVPRNATLGAGESKNYDVPKCPLDRNGDTVTLLDEDGLKIAGVSYRSRQEDREGGSIPFGRRDSHLAAG